MNDAQYEATCDYVRFLLSTIECADWRVILKRTHPDDENAIAMIHPTEGRKLAVLFLCKEFFDMPREDIRHALIHECCHLIARDQNDVVRLTLPGLLGQSAYTALWEPYRLACEVATDTMAYAFAALIHDDQYLDAIVNSGGEPS